MATKFRKILGYSRVSTAEQAADNRTSLASQEREIRGVAMIHGIEPAEIFTDAGVSGGIPLADRPAGARLSAALEPGVCIVASRLDRAFRSASDALATVEKWKSQGVDLILVDCGADPVSSNGASRLFFGILASVAQFEKERIAERMQEGKRAKAAKGGLAGGLPPYGFRKIGQGRAAMLEPNECEQAIIKRMLKMKKSGKTIREITAQLNAENIRLRNGGIWLPSQVHRTITMATKRMQTAT